MSAPAVLVLACTLLCARAFADTSRAPVQLHLADCIPAPSAVRRLFTMEIDIDLRAEDGAATQASALCRGRRVELRIDDALTGKSLRRSIDLFAAAPRARPRLLALALAELLFASWAELALEPVPSIEATLPGEPLPSESPPVSEVAMPPPSAPRATPAAKEAARTLLRRRLPQLAPSTGLRLTARASLQAFLQEANFLGGVAMQLGGDHGHRLGWSFDAAYHIVRGESTLGALSAETLSGGLALLFQHQQSLRALPVSLRAGGGLRAGAIRLAGTPTAGAQAQGGLLWAPLVGPTGVLSGSLLLPRRLVLDLMIEGGYLLTPAYGLASGVRVIALAGPWLGLQLGIGVMP